MTNTPQKSQDYYRFCPGEERIKLSDAVCLGRRRSNFPKCKSCQFNDDLRGKPAAPVMPTVGATGAVPPADRPQADRIGQVFQANDIRARSPDPLNDDAAWRIGQASAQFLRSELRGYDRSQPDKSSVVVGRDMRKSSPALAAALIEGLRAGGSPVIDIGMVDTPQLYFAVNRLTCCGGVQVTASHNPAEYNGFKICGQRARPVSTDTGLTKIRKIAENTLRHIAGPLASIEKADVSEDYKTFVRGFLDEEIASRTAENPLKIDVIKHLFELHEGDLILVIGQYVDESAVPFEAMVRVGKQHGIPVYVDAAAERPDLPNWYLARGADAVGYSGGKSLRGPQCSGVAIGRKDLLQAAAQNTSPNASYGRPMKVGKEEILGVLAAMESWVRYRDHAAERKAWEGMLAHIAGAVADIPSVTTEVIQPARIEVTPKLAIGWDPAVVGCTTRNASSALLSGSPRIRLSGRDDQLVVVPFTLVPGEEQIIAERMSEILRNGKQYAQCVTPAVPDGELVA